jgi:hypothetical protein
MLSKVLQRPNVKGAASTVSRLISRQTIKGGSQVDAEIAPPLSCLSGSNMHDSEHSYVAKNNLVKS